MTRSIKLAVSVALALSATSVFATNGDNLIGLGAKSRAMGGVGVATKFGAESGLANPALISGNEVSFGGTYFAPSVDFKNSASAMGPDGAYHPADQSDYESSAADKSVIPEVAISMEVNKNFTWGVGMYGVAGMGVDYRDDTAVLGSLNKANATPQNPSGFTPSTDGKDYFGTMNGTNNMLTNLQLMRFAVPLAYNVSGFSIGIAPILQYGSLSMAYNAGQYYSDAMGNNHNTMTGRGVSQDLGFGYQFGLGYEITGLTLGLSYTSAIDMTYDNQISEATKQFGLNQGKGLDDNLEQPSEFAIGASYQISGNTIALDYKKIAWGSAKGYKDFKWEDQNVIALGYEYAAKGWALRAGYNYASNPIKEQTAASMQTDYDGAVINYFNMAGFPATVESHYTVGGTYNFSDAVGLDLAFVYAPKTSTTMDTSAMTQAQTFAAAMKGGFTQQEAGQMAGAMKSEASVDHSQMGLTVAMTIKF